MPAEPGLVTGVPGSDDSSDEDLDDIVVTDEDDVRGTMGAGLRSIWAQKVAGSLYSMCPLRKCALPKSGYLKRLATMRLKIKMKNAHLDCCDNRVGAGSKSSEGSASASHETRVFAYTYVILPAL